MRNKITIVATSLFMFSLFNSTVTAQTRPTEDRTRAPYNTLAETELPRNQLRTDLSEAKRQMAKDRQEKIKAEVEARRLNVKEEICQRMQNQFQNMIPRLATDVKTKLSVFDKIFARVQGFYDSGRLTVDNYSSLKAAVDAARGEAAASVAVVESFQFTLDCTNPNVAAQLDGYRSSIAEARQALKNYRANLVSLISALRSEAAKASNREDREVNGDNQEETE